MYKIRHLTDHYIQIGDSGLIPVEAIGDINLVFHQLDEHGNPEDVVACVQDVIYTPWLGFNLFSFGRWGTKTTVQLTQQVHKRGGSVSFGDRQTTLFTPPDSPVQR